MSTKRSRLFAASTSIVGGSRDGKQYRNVGPLPTFGAEKEKLQTPGSKLQRNTKPQAPKVETAAPAKAKGPGLLARCFAKLKGVFGRRASTSAVPKFARQPVQGELSLDNVKVKCNDLSDTDFELVAKAVPTMKKPAPAAPEEVKPATTAPVAETGTRIWNRMTTLLGAGQS